MRWVKKFESSEDDVERQYGVNEDDIRYLLTDISDEGWEIYVRFKKVLLKVNKAIIDRQLTMGLIPFIEVSIKRSATAGHDRKNLESLMKSELFLETIEVFGERLKEKGLFIKSYFNDGNIRLTILIYRKSDENYIN